ncbi:hypothetical protein ABZ403_13990 [Micromonospora zamorensis]|uniref:hypothetical protein n=1 Tax=Micromonospora zamorensis TaxID=709883 RepID=UPI0033C97BD7
MIAQALPDVDGRWITPTSLAALLEELELCGVPLEATPKEARRLLELSCVWVPDRLLTKTLHLRWQAAGRTGPIPKDPYASPRYV